MVATVDVISEASHKHAKEVTSLAFDGEHLYSGSEDGVINVWTKDLKFSREIAIHKDYPVLALVVNSHKQLYSCGRDGSLRYFRRPWSHDHNDILLQTVMDDVTCLYVENDILYSGDDKGIITKWYHNQVGGQYNVTEEVKSMAVEENTLYTVRESDVVITDITPHQMAQVTKGTIPGRYPLILMCPERPKIPEGRRGSYIEAQAQAQQRRPSYSSVDRRPSNAPEVSKHKLYIIAATRDGKGIAVINNESPYKTLATKENAHSMIINVMCSIDEYLFTAGYDGKVKKWKNVENGPELVEEIDTGKCINAMIPGPEHTVYVGDADGFVKRLQFTDIENIVVE